LDRGRGRLEVNGELWLDSERGISIPTHRRPLGYVFQEAGLFPHVNVRGNLQYGYRRTPVGERRISREDVMEWLGLRPLLDRSPEDLSGGERQRVAIGRALVTSPRLLLMDEPMSALDEASRQEILPYLERLHRELELPVLYVSHAFKEVARLSDYMVLMQKGRVQAEGPIESVMTRLDLQAFPEGERGAVIDAVIDGHDETYHLTALRFPGGILRVARRPFPPGHPVRIQIPAADVSLTLRRDEGTSILNILPGRIEEIAPAGPAQILVKLRLGEPEDPGTAMIARITRKSGDVLQLKAGMPIFAQIKSVALMR
jgi:molybdate transport system ATP-binding protein